MTQPTSAYSESESAGTSSSRNNSGTPTSSDDVEVRQIFERSASLPNLQPATFLS